MLGRDEKESSRREKNEKKKVWKTFPAFLLVSKAQRERERARERQKRREKRARRERDEGELDGKKRDTQRGGVAKQEELENLFLPPLHPLFFLFFFFFFLFFSFDLLALKSAGPLRVLPTLLS